MLNWACRCRCSTMVGRCRVTMTDLCVFLGHLNKIVHAPTVENNSVWRGIWQLTLRLPMASLAITDIPWYEPSDWTWSCHSTHSCMDTQWWDHRNLCKKNGRHRIWCDYWCGVLNMRVHRNIFYMNDRHGMQSDVYTNVQYEIWETTETFVTRMAGIEFNASTDVVCILANNVTIVLMNLELWSSTFRHNMGCNLILARNVFTGVCWWAEETYCAQLKIKWKLI